MHQPKSNVQKTLDYYNQFDNHQLRKQVNNEVKYMAQMLEDRKNLPVSGPRREPTKTIKFRQTASWKAGQFISIF